MISSSSRARNWLAKTTVNEYETTGMETNQVYSSPPMPLAWLSVLDSSKMNAALKMKDGYLIRSKFLDHISTNKRK